jgi:hypothetical protein
VTTPDQRGRVTPAPSGRAATSAPAASQDRPPLPERTQTPAGPVQRAVETGPAGASGEEFRKRVRAAQSAHNAAKLRGRFTRAARQPGPGMIRKPPPGADTGRPGGREHGSE